MGFSQIKMQIQEQTEKTTCAVLEIICILDLLPPYSMERMILEYRHIDCMEWNLIQKAIHLSPAPCYEWYNRGLDFLLKRQQVRRILRLDDCFPEERDEQIKQNK